MSTQHLSEQEIIRRDKLSELKKLGIDPYPAALYPVNTTSVFIKENYKGEESRLLSGKADFIDVCLAGRVMSVRDMGKASFAVLQDVPARSRSIFAKMIYAPVMIKLCMISCGKK